MKIAAPAKSIDAVSHGQEGSDVAGRLLQNDKSAHVGNDSDAVDSTVAKSKKLPRRRKALVRVAPNAESTATGQQAELVDTSRASQKASQGISKAARSSSCASVDSQTLSTQPLSVQHGNELSAITEERVSPCSDVLHLSSPSNEVAEFHEAAHSGQHWAVPVEDAWCYTPSSPERSMHGSPQQAAHVPSPKHSSAQLQEHTESSSKDVPMHSSNKVGLCASQTAWHLARCRHATVKGHQALAYMFLYSADGQTPLYTMELLAQDRGCHARQSSASHCMHLEEACSGLQGLPRIIMSFLTAVNMQARMP